ncbi:hypothetical protein Vretimale_11650 [Volvox reticuliferus]|uniref:Guanylate cyclase domain-containing protein n=1 Tax=Volvox reticuliferus TaxID=1737510 RepID=A0A8J4GHZ7_9CHLO|nr:hypothetical protein Vretimale_11650 [Volvox reticuliferus]
MMLFGATKAVAELGQPAVNALQQFKSLVTRECCDCGGFVVEATDGLCLAAFMEPAAAAIWALRCQTNLCAHNWSPEVLASPYFREVREYQRIQRGRGQPGRRVTNVICRGPRIRTGISVGSVTAEVSSATARLSYRGKVMNRSARVASQATDNQVCVYVCVHGWGAMRIIAPSQEAKMQFRGCGPSQRKIRVRSVRS